MKPSKRRRLIARYTKAEIMAADKRRRRAAINAKGEARRLAQQRSQEAAQ